MMSGSPHSATPAGIPTAQQEALQAPPPWLDPVNLATSLYAFGLLNTLIGTAQGAGTDKAAEWLYHGLSGGPGWAKGDIEKIKKEGLKGGWFAQQPEPGYGPQYLAVKPEHLPPQLPTEWPFHQSSARWYIPQWQPNANLPPGTERQFPEWARSYEQSDVPESFVQPGYPSTVVAPENIYRANARGKILGPLVGEEEPGFLSAIARLMGLVE